jgi:hypothetical protein
MPKVIKVTTRIDNVNNITYVVQTYDNNTYVYSVYQKNMATSCYYLVQRKSGVCIKGT